MSAEQVAHVKSFNLKATPPFEGNPTCEIGKFRKCLASNPLWVRSISKTSENGGSWYCSCKPSFGNFLGCALIQCCTLGWTYKCSLARAGLFNREADWTILCRSSAHNGKSDRVSILHSIGLHRQIILKE